jgi:hypothetical protein
MSQDLKEDIKKFRFRHLHPSSGWAQPVTGALPGWDTEERYQGWQNG